MKKLFIIIISVVASILCAQSKINYQLLNVNNIRIGLTNVGNLKNQVGYGGAFWHLQNKDSVIVYDQGPWIIGKINNKIHLSISQWGTNYSPGPIINNKAAMQYKPEDSLKYRVYKISKGDNNTNKDYLEWPYEFGAPKAKDGKPRLYQDQTLWTVFNQYDPAFSFKNFVKDTLPITPIEIHQTAFSKKGNSKDEIDLFSNTVFFEWTIINKGTLPIDSAYFSFWTDIDFGLSGWPYNIPQMDSVTGLGYLWSNTTDPQLAVGYVMLYGPAVQSIGQKAVFKGKVKTGYKNLDITSNDAFFGASGMDKRFALSKNKNDAWNIARGFYTTGETKINPTNNKPTKFTFTGDPVTDKGWIWKTSTGGGTGFNLFSGPFNLAPNDTQWVMMALVPALGKDYKESITIMRNKVKLLRSMPYDSIAFGRNAVKVGINQEKELPKQFVLNQNYPNPFNPETIISYIIPKSEHVTIKVFDVLGREIAVLVNGFQTKGTNEVEFDASQLSSGVYFYSIQSGEFAQTKKMMLVR